MPTLTDTEIAPRLRVVIARLSRRLRPAPAAVAAGLTPTRISLLLHVARAEQIRLAELAESEAINPTMLSRVVAELVHGGLLDRLTDEGDRRAAWVRPTAAGRRLAQRIRRERTDALNLALAKLSDADRRHIEDALPALERLGEVLRDDGP
jgi:DNA-binding MarR family transcriptional regulator